MFFLHQKCLLSSDISRDKRLHVDAQQASIFEDSRSRFRVILARKRITSGGIVVRGSGGVRALSAGSWGFVWTYLVPARSVDTIHTVGDT